MLPTPFGGRVHARRSNRGCDHLDVGAGEEGVERGGELGVPIADQEPEVFADVVEVHGEVAGWLG
jgi:hypothetical protein